MEPSEAASLIRRLGLERLLEPVPFGREEVETMSAAFTREESAETAAEVSFPIDPSRHMQIW
jgi:hypothetical protein